MIEAPNIPSLIGLVELARRDGVDIWPTLLRVMTDLYIQKPVHTEDEERQYTELATRLIDLVDAPTRAIVAGKISNYPGAPASVRQRLSQQHDPVGPPTADPFLGSDISAEELSELFFTASAEERRLILLNLAYAPRSPAAPIADEAARESIRRLETAALAHNSDAFARELERALGVSRTQARRMMDDTSGEPIVVAAVALGMPAAVLQRILLCLNPAISRSVQRVYDLALLHEEVEREMALRLLAIWQSNRRLEKKPAPARPASATLRPRAGSRSTRAGLPARPPIRWDELAQTRKSDAS
jgi:hypothetical protein